MEPRLNIDVVRQMWLPTPSPETRSILKTNPSHSPVWSPREFPGLKIFVSANEEMTSFVLLWKP